MKTVPEKIKMIKHTLIPAVGIVFMAWLLSLPGWRVDLTQEKRYTLHPVTREMLKKLPGDVQVTVYLEGNMPAGFKRLATATGQMLELFERLSRHRLTYRFVDPLENADPKARRQMVESLYEKGLQPTNVKMKDETENLSEKLLIPGAILSYKNKEVAVNLLQKNIGATAEENLNHSIEMIEYAFVIALQGLMQDTVIQVAFIEGHGELDDYQTADISREMEMSLRYKVFRGRINKRVSCLDPYKVVIVAKPQMPFTESEKFVLDQYLMKGGRILWLLDKGQVNLDSLVGGMAFAFVRDCNLDDQLFRYGVRINQNLLQDVQCALVPVNIALQGETPRFVPVPFYYLPLIAPAGTHPVCRNLNLIRGEFVNTLDTVNPSASVKKIPLMMSSAMAKTTGIPAMISLREAKRNLAVRERKNPCLLGVLLEGVFTSNFKNRMISQLDVEEKNTIITESKPTRMAVIADGGIIKNSVRYTEAGAQILPLGFDRYSHQTYGNREFLMNLINYLAGDERILELRNRQVMLRLLDKARIKREKIKWKIINVMLPLAVILGAAILVQGLRRRKYRPLPE